ncbi:MAG: hypothetical protein AAB403_09190, partial [Planctomycetota bacterium]
MKAITRRRLSRAPRPRIAGETPATLVLAALAPYSRVLGANNDIRVAVVGFNSQGSNHIKYFSKLPGVRLVALCDVDRDV